MIASNEIHPGWLDLVDNAWARGMRDASRHVLDHAEAVGDSDGKVDCKLLGILRALGHELEEMADAGPCGLGGDRPTS